MINVFKAIGHGLSRAWFWYKAQYRGRWYQRIVTPIATFIVLFFLYLRAVDVDFLGLFGKSPDMEIIENPINDEASLIYSADSVLIGKFFNENRSPVQFEEISPYMIDALISTEDERFYLHHGIDYGGLFAAFKDMLKGNARGASTITQQLVKNLFKMRSQYSTGVLGRVPVLKILIMKSKEWITAIKIENLYSKKDILTLYLNTVDFGSNAFGIKTAAKTYFNTTPDQLNPQQCATLVGLLKATTTYNPKVNPKNSLARRNVVLNNMRKYGSLTKQECDSISQLPMDLSYSVENTYDGQAQYFREKLKDYLADWCKENNINLYADGLKIYTTVDTRLQKYAEEAVLKQMRVLQQRFDQHWRGRTPWRDEYGREIPNFIENIAKNSSYYKILEKKYPNQPDSIDFYMNQPHTVKLFTYDTPDRTMECEISTMDSIRYMVRQMHCGFVAMEPQTSFVRAWVGDIDFNAWKYDKVTAMRQPGSTFKLFVYAAAMEVLGLTPTDRRQDSYISIPVTDSKGKKGYWTPHNANGYCTNAYVTLRAAFARSINTIAVKLGQEAGIPYVINMAKRMGIKSKLENLPSLALGASNEVPLPKRAMNYRTAFYMQRLLWAGMHEPGGTTQALWEYIHCYDTEFGGKTGTSSNHSDAWFVGCSPYLVGGAWFGGEYRSIHFRTGALGQGSRTALPIFGYFMDKVMHDSNFKHYHGKFPEMKEEILAETYEGDYEDSLEMDSLDYLLSDSDYIYSNYD